MVKSELYFHGLTYIKVRFYMGNDQYLHILRILSEYFTGTEKISGKYRERSFEYRWIYYLLSNDKEKIPNTFAVLFK